MPFNPLAHRKTKLELREPVTRAFGVRGSDGSRGFRTVASQGLVYVIGIMVRIKLQE